MLPADIFLTLRYLKPRRNMVSIISLLTIFGPVIGVAIMVIVTSIMTGFHVEMKKNLLNINAHFEILPNYMQTSIADYDTIIERLHKKNIFASPVCEGSVLIQNNKSAKPAYLRGILPEFEKNVTNFDQFKIASNGRFIDKESFTLKTGEAILGAGLANQLQIKVGDKILLHSPEKLSQNFVIADDGSVKEREDKEAYLPEEVTVIATFTSGLANYDREIMLINLHQAADLFGLDFGSAAYIHGVVEDPMHMQESLKTIRSCTGRYYVRPWHERHQALYDALFQEKVMMTFVLSFIVLIASFCIGCVMFTVVIQKTREIGILKALGFTPFNIARIFIYQGFIFGIVGTSGGIAAGLTILHYRKQVAAFISKIIGSQVFNSETYNLYELPAIINYTDISIIAGLAISLCILAAAFPAIYAATLKPAKAIQEGN